MTTAAVVAYYNMERKARISYAGHPPVLYRRANEKSWTYARPTEREVSGNSFPQNIPLAIDSDTYYGQFSISFAPGDRLFIYSDGIIEAPGADGESFGLTRLKQTLDANPAAPPAELKAIILNALRRFTQNGLAHDDITLIILEIC